MSELRAALQDAIEEVGDETEEVAEVVEPTPEVVEPTPEETTPEVVEPTPEVVAAPELEPKEDPEPEVVAKGKEYNVEKAPSGWTPANRELWGALSPEVKQQVMKRDREVDDVLRDTAEARRSFKQFNETIDPFRALISSQNSEPMQAIGGLLQTAATLQMGTMQQKAERISQLINHYGVDISTLDTILSGQKPENTPDAAMQAAIDKRMQPMENFFQQMKTRQIESQQTSDRQVQDDIGAFEAKAEFFDDVRMDMADLMDFATKRGQEMTLQGAYDKACSLHPEISKVIAQRKTQTDLGIKKATVNGTLNAKLGGVENPLEGNSMRATIEALWDGDDV